MSEILWEAPTSGSEGDGEFEDAIQALKDNTGKWAVIATRPTSHEAGYLVGRIKNAKGAWAGSKWEATQRTLNGEKRIYARHLGFTDAPTLEQERAENSA